MRRPAVSTIRGGRLCFRSTLRHSDRASAGTPAPRSHRTALRHGSDAARSSIDALIGAGRFGVIQDRELRDRLTGFLNLADDLAEESRRMQSGSEAVLQRTITHGGPWQDELGPSAAFGDLPDVTPEDLAAMRADSIPVGWIGFAHQYSATYLEEVRELGVAVEEALSRLGTEMR